MLKATGDHSALQNHSFVPLPISPHRMLVVSYDTCYQSQRRKGHTWLRTLCEDPHTWLARTGEQSAGCIGIMGVVHGSPEGFPGVGTLEDNSLYLLYNPSILPYIER